MPLDSTMSDSTTLANRVLLISLNIRTFTGEKTDRRFSEEIAETHNADVTDSGRYQKKIIGKQALERIKKIASAARAHHYDVTLPWTDEGARLLSVDGYFTYMEKMRAFTSQFEAAVEEFLQAYPQLIDQAKARLGGMFDHEDYPPVSKLRERFTFQINASPLPVSNNWFLNIAETEMAELRRSTDLRVEQAVTEAMKEVWGRIADKTKKMVDKLTAYRVDPETGKVVDGIFRDSLVENIKDLVDLLPTLNITNDPELAALVLELRELTRHDASALRADEGFRQDTAAKAKAIYDKAAMFL
jgi:hypothetical protein